MDVSYTGLNIFSMATAILNDESPLRGVFFVTYHAHVFLYLFSMHFFRQERVALLDSKNFLTKTKYFPHFIIGLSSLFGLLGFKFIFDAGKTLSKFDGELYMMIGILFIAFAFFIFLLSIPTMIARSYALKVLSGNDFKFARKPIVHLKPKSQSKLTNYEVNTHEKC